MTETKVSTNGIEQIAEEYLGSMAKEVDHAQKDELRQQIEDYQERYKKLVQEHGEDHNLAIKAEGILGNKEDELAELEEGEDEIEIIREKLLQKIGDEFELNERWLQTEVTKAVNHALYGKRDSSFMLFGEEIQSLEDLEGVDEFGRIERAEVVIHLAKDRLGQSQSVKEQYQRLNDSNSFAAFEILAQEGSLGSAEVAELLDKKKGTVNNWLKSPINFWDRMIPFYRPKKGEYDLSTTGRYFLQHFYNGEGELGEEAEESNEVDAPDDSADGETGQTQATLGGSPVSSDQSGDGDSNSESGEGPSNLSKIEDTEKKAEEMFSRVGGDTDS